MRDRGPLSNTHPVSLVAAACSLALFAAIAWPLLTGRVFVFDDLANFHLPLRFLYQQALQAGDSLLWTPSILAGLYVHGEGQLGACHPLHLLLYGVLPLGVAFDLEMLASYVAGFVGMAWLLRRLHLSDAAALAGAMLFAFGGFTLLHHHHLNMVAVVAHLPWLLIGADAVTVETRGPAWRRGFALLALAMGSSCLLGFPQAVWWNSMVVAAFAITRAAEHARRRALIACAAAAGIGVLIGGIQLLPTADAAAHSVRVAVASDFALTYSLHPANLLQLWSPRVFANGAFSDQETLLLHEFGIYSGALLPVSLCWMWSRWRATPARRALLVLATSLAVGGVWLALGRYGGIAALLAQAPVLSSLRAPTRYILLTQIGLTILAALTIDDLLAIREGRAEPPRRTLAVWLPALLAIGTLLAINTGWLPVERYGFSSVMTAAPGVAICVGVSLLVTLAARRVAWALPALIVLTAGDLALWGVRFMYREPPRPASAVAHAAPEAPRDVEASYAAAADAGLYRSNQLVLRGYRMASGYVGLYPASRHLLGGDEALRLSGARWRFTLDGVRHTIDGAVSRVRLLDRSGRDAASGQARMALDRPGRLVAHVNVSGPRVLAFTERFHAGWSATADGRPLATVPVEGDFLGVVVDAGVQRVTLRFMPRSFVYGAATTIVGLLGLVGMLVYSRSRSPASDRNALDDADR